MVDPGVQPYVPPAPATPARSRMPLFLSLAIGVLLVCCAGLPAVVLVVGDGEETVASAPRGAPVKRATDPPPAAPAPTTTPPPAKPGPLPADVTYKGRGNKVVKLKAPATDVPTFAAITYRGSGNFVVWSVGRDGEPLDLVVNAIGAYKGTRPFNFRGEPGTLRVESSGSWEIVVKALAKAPVWPARTSGKGPAVLRVLKSPVKAKVTYKGTWNFVVNSYAEYPDLLVNKIGKYSGTITIPAGTNVVAVDTVGSWTMKPA
ncbi:hypothetical protein [Actinoplanes solisilvae]|uniref:hypothetical protein n=1 Tax=Actinoplanes solisilvae TaxID=2486853 RepID=UPI000FD7348F|nr:hypothetical protein [Actinoplanes solisilvae]